MPRDLVIGNGNILLCLDGELCLRDFYYPFVGMYNHVGGQKCRLGVWTDDHFQWVERWTWQIRPGYVAGSLLADSTAQSEALGLRLRIREGVHFRENIYLRRITVQNQVARARQVRLFLAYDLSIQETNAADTAFMDPFAQAIIHYKRGTYFLINGSSRQGGIAQFATGIKGFAWAEGTWRDAEDGHLQGNPIAHGSVDSTVGFQLHLEASGEETLDCWIVVGDDLDEVKRVNASVLQRTAARLLDDTDAFWRTWVGQVGAPLRARPGPPPEGTGTGASPYFGDLPAEVTDLFHRSLLVLRAQIDNHGAVIAASDSEHLREHRDSYNYMWPRDGALAAYALDRAGYSDVTRKFFEFCANGLTEGGYLCHKYLPNGSLGANWLPWMVAGRVELPIQEDETALVLYALWHHYSQFRDIEWSSALYQRLVRPAAEFLYHYRDRDTGLPLPSWNLWQDRRGIFTFTAATVNAGLTAAASFAQLLGATAEAARYARGAAEVRDAIAKHLYDETLGRYATAAAFREDGSLALDETLDSSLFGLFAFGTLPVEDEGVAQTIEAVREGLRVQTEVGGIARYAGDPYHRHGDHAVVPGNPWFVSTLWMSQWQIARAHNFKELHAAMSGLLWACRHATRTGLLAEQVHPYTGQPLSVCPLTWSHSTFIITVLDYLEKLAVIRQHGGTGNGRGTPGPAHTKAQFPS
jgi:GH15 family glucan-1,4-alpha-glucosidase